MAGISTLTFRDGRWLHHLDAASGNGGGECFGTYSVTRGRVAILVGPGLRAIGCGAAGIEVFNARWTLDGGELRFLDVRSKVDTPIFTETFWGGKPWRKIG